MTMILPSSLFIPSRTSALAETDDLTAAASFRRNRSYHVIIARRSPRRVIRFRRDRSDGDAAIAYPSRVRVPVHYIPTRVTSSERRGNDAKSSSVSHAGRGTFFSFFFFFFFFSSANSSFSSLPLINVRAHKVHLRVTCTVCTLVRAATTTFAETVYQLFTFKWDYTRARAVFEIFFFPKLWF